MKTKRILYLCDLDITHGGAQRITSKTLDCISKFFNLEVYLPELPSQESLNLLERLNIDYKIDLVLAAESLKSTLLSKHIDLILIQWENPKWISLIYNISKSLGIEYAVFCYELPFIGTPTSKFFRNWFLLVLLKYFTFGFKQILSNFDKKTEHNFRSKMQVINSKIKGDGNSNFLLYGLHLTVEFINNILETKRGLKNAKQIIAMGSAGKFYIDKYLKVKNVIELSRIASSDILVDVYQYPKNLKYDICFMAARLIPQKGIFDVIEVCYHVKKILGYELKIVILGKFVDDHTKTMFMSNVNKRNLESNIFLPGFVSEENKGKIINLSRVFLYPSTKDIFSISLADALECGLPSVVYDLPFVKQFDDIGINKIKYKNINSMSRKVAELIDIYRKEPTKYWDIRSRIRTNFRSNFSWETTCREQVRVLTGIFS